MKKEEIAKKIIASILYNPEHWNICRLYFQAEDFADDELRAFRVFYNLNDEMDLTIGNMTVALWEDGLDVSKYSEVGRPIDTISFEYMCKVYSNIDAMEKFNLILKGFKPENIEDIEKIQGQLNEILELDKKFLKEKPVSYEVDEILVDLDEEIKDNSKIIMSNCYPSFNEFTQGLSAGNLVTICGAYKQGKTTFGLQLLLSIIKQSKIMAGVFSLEVSKRELIKRLLSMTLKIPYNHLRNPKNLTDEDYIEIKEQGYSAIKGMNFLVYDRPIDLQVLKSKARIWKEQYDVGLIFIDYIGLIKSKGENRERELSFISQELKNLAKELRVVVLSLAQLNRAGLHKPTSENTAESISIARDSDYMFIISKPDVEFYKTIKVDNEEIDNNGYFIVKCELSRHSEAGKRFVLEPDYFMNLKETKSDYGELFRKLNPNLFS
uniref:Putative helicase n=1 Tax=viral metagenome TaxID=1070528 RepID=A0A6H1ZT90_9ZZZZ